MKQHLSWWTHKRHIKDILKEYSQRAARQELHLTQQSSLTGCVTDCSTTWVICAIKFTNNGLKWLICTLTGSIVLIYRHIKYFCFHFRDHIAGILSKFWTVKKGAFSNSHPYKPPIKVVALQHLAWQICQPLPSIWPDPITTINLTWAGLIQTLYMFWYSVLGGKSSCMKWASRSLISP